jgi:putative FmdB family regulatory protein
MPIYEYEALNPGRGCEKCAGIFEVIQGMDEKPLAACPACGRKVRRIISWCRAAVVEASEEHARVENRISEYERQGMWSHAAELADKHSEKIGDRGTKTRALENYKKAGYDADSLEKHAKDNKI